MVSSKKRQCSRSQQESTVEDQSALVDANDFKGHLAIVGPVGDDVGHSKPHNTAGHEPKTEVGGKAGWASLATRKPKPS